MTGGTRIIAIGGGVDQDHAADEAIAAAEQPFETAATVDWYEEEPVKRSSRSWILPLLALLAVGAWSSFFAWANQWALGGVSPQQGVTLLTSWAIPVLLVCVAWLIAMRSSRREALRFGETARLLSDESSRLEQRLTTVNRELSLAREFLASQSRDLETLGRTASERLSHHAENLQSLVQNNGSQIEAIATVSTTALDNMEKLRGHLPVIASSAKDVANNIGNAGRTAHAQLSEMIDGFKRLNEFGQASETHVDNLRARIDNIVEFLGTRLDDLRDRADKRFAEIEAKNTEFGAALSANEDEVLASIRERSRTLQDELAAVRITLDSQETESLASFRVRMESLHNENNALARSLRDGEASAVEAFSRARDQLEGNVKEMLERLDALDAQAMAASRSRIAQISEEAGNFDARLAERNRLFAEETERRSELAHEAHVAYAERIDAVLAAIDDRLKARTADHEAHSRIVSASGDAISARLDAASDRVAAIAAQVSKADSQLGARLSNLTAQLENSQTALVDTGSAIARLTDDSVRLLELLQASAQQSNDRLPEALALGEARLEEFEQRIAALRDGVEQTAARSEDVAKSVEGMRGTIGLSLGEISALQRGLEDGAVRHRHVLGELKTSLKSLDAESTRIAESSQGELTAALNTLTEATKQAITILEKSGTRTIASLAEKLGEESGATIERVLRTRTAEAVGALEEAAGHAAGVSRESAIQLRDQLTRIDELTGNLERRVDQARQRAEEQVDSDFSRRVALITESLNSNSIDIAKALSSDVTDTAWASYLRGDRGVFTRRAVRLLETQEARSIAQIYGEDSEFREHVSRYIHDFEGMLRQLLSTRDGHALSVTLLSSDMGKLYVALAQALERLRN